MAKLFLPIDELIDEKVICQYYENTDNDILSARAIEMQKYNNMQIVQGGIDLQKRLEKRVENATNNCKKTFVHNYKY